jgi:transposase InsO family protein
MKHKEQARLKWVQMYLDTGNAGLTCRRCGISRPTLRKWVGRYQSDGLEGLHELSRRPKTSPNQKIFAEQEKWILELRRERRLGARRIQHELRRLYGFHLSLASIHKVLTQYKAKRLRRRRHKRLNRYERPVPGERVQVDTIEIAPGLYQYTAIDDCTRWLMTALFPRRSAKNSVEFLEMVMTAMLFPVQRIQTDRGTEFTAYAVQESLWYWRIKWRPIPPGMPHLNGKVERVQQTILDEFYAVTDLSDPKLEINLSDWEIYYNRERIHGSLGKTPLERLNELYDKSVIPGWEEVDEQFSAVAEFLRLRSYGIDIYVPGM